jgi:hypothetical protein
MFLDNLKVGSVRFSENDRNIGHEISSLNTSPKDSCLIGKLLQDVEKKEAKKVNHRALNYKVSNC